MRTQAALAKAIGADKTRIIGVLDDLQERELVQRQPDPADRRVHLLALTPAGLGLGFPLLGRVCRLGDSLDGPEPGVPSRGGGGHRLCGGFEPLGLDGAANLATVASLGDQARFEQDRQVLGDRLPGERQFLGQRGRRGFAVGHQHVKEATASRLGHRRPQRVDVLGGVGAAAGGTRLRWSVGRGYASTAWRA
jgi:MarR family